MNKWQKEVQQASLNNEKEVLKQIKKNYEEAVKTIDGNIAQLLVREDADMQHVIYQIEYQKALKKQNEAILLQLQENNFETVSEYLTKCYEDGFIGAMYDISGQGIPLIVPIDQAQVVQAIITESKLSTSLYDAFDIKDLQKEISAEISRGISSQMTFGEISRNISNRSGISQRNAIRIARTEGHRIQCSAQLHACEKAKSKGADVVKQWDSTLDGNTRDSHRRLDGQIREIDEPFEIDGMTAMHPSDFGDPSEDINCRCVCNQRARWALDQDELETLENRAEYYGLDKTDDFEDFKEKYLKASEDESEEDLFERFNQTSDPAKAEKEFLKGLDNVSNPDAKLVLEDLHDRVQIQHSNNGKTLYKNDVVYLGQNQNPDTLAHEYFHHAYAEVSKQEEAFLKAELNKDYAKLYTNASKNDMEIGEYLATKHPDMFKEGSSKVKAEYRGFSDIIHGITDGQVDLGYGHRKSGYWDLTDKLQSETMAQYGRMYYNSDVNVRKVIEEELPNVTKRMDEKVKEMADVLRKTK